MKKVIVTGAGGFLGKALTRMLISKDVEVFAVVRQGAQLPAESDPQVHVIYCDLEEIAGLEQLIPHGEYDACYHLAWAGTSGDARGDHLLQITNINHSCEALIAANRIGCKKMIFAGSIMEYECMSQILTDESAPDPMQIYGAAKLSAHLMLRILAAGQGTPFIEAIISNVYGVGECSERFISRTLRKFLRSEPVQFTSGKQLYDFIYITDAVDALILLGEKGEGGQSYYIGNTHPRPLMEFIREMHECAGPGFPLILGELPETAAPLSYREFDTMKMSREFEFEPEINFTDGILRTLRWLNGNL